MMMLGHGLKLAWGRRPGAAWPVSLRRRHTGTAALPGDGPVPVPVPVLTSGCFSSLSCVTCVCTRYSLLALEVSWLCRTNAGTCRCPNVVHVVYC